jgi:ribonuclease HI
MIKIKLFSDGSAKGNPDGPGGYGTIVKYVDEVYDEETKTLSITIKKVEEFTGGFPVTSNNRMEMMGVIVGLESLKEPYDVTITTDSSYIVNAFTNKWIDKWQQNGWKTSKNEPVKNKDLWERMLLVKEPHNVTFNWVKGHNGHPENERCDYLATSSADNKEFIKGDDGILIEKKVDEDKI